MLFLLNDRIVDVALPEMHLERRWKRLGCGAPYALRAEEAVGFVQARIEQARALRRRMSEEEACDLASLIIARTGANSFILRYGPDGRGLPELHLYPAPVLEAFAIGAGACEADFRRAMAG